MANQASRRKFLVAAPMAAVASVAFGEELVSGVAPAPAVPFQVFPAQMLMDAEKTLQATPGNKSLIDGKQLPVTVVMTTETGKSAKEFEWHEGRDHLVQILDGATVYEVGGTPVNGRNTRPMEWLAPGAEGSTRLELKKGDMVLIPRGTLHKRSTAGSVTFLLISTVGSPAA